MKIKALIIGLVSAVAVTACTQQKIADEWEGYRDETLGIAFSYPASYIPEQVTEDTIVFGSGTIAVKQLYLREGPGEAPFMEVTVTNQPKIMQTLIQDHPLEEVPIGEKTLKKFKHDGMGDPVGYVLHQRPWIILTFVFPPEEEVQERIVASFVMMERE